MRAQVAYSLATGRRVAASRSAILAAAETLDGLPSLAQTMVNAAALPMPVEALEEIIKQDESEPTAGST